MEIQTIRTTENLAASKGDRRCCTINALSVSAGIPFDIAQQIGFKAGRKLNRGFHGKKLLPVAKRYGVTYRKLRFNRMTLQKFIRTYPTGKYYVETTSHAFAVIDGVVNDWRENKAGCILVEAFLVTSSGTNGRAVKLKKEKPKKHPLACRPDEYKVRSYDKHGQIDDVEYFDRKGDAVRHAREIGKNGAAAVFAHLDFTKYDPDGVWRLEFVCGKKKLWLKKAGVEKPMRKKRSDPNTDQIPEDASEKAVLDDREDRAAGRMPDDYSDDGDALASAGWGTDEDYGYYGGDE